jgi:hypothetical protein
MVVRSEQKAINGLPPMSLGIMPITGQHYFFTRVEMDAFIAAEPGASAFFRPFIGADEFINGKERFILHLCDVPGEALEQLPLVQERMRAVSDLRAKSKKASTRQQAACPTKYEEGFIPTTPFLLVPLHTSDDREYVPMGFFTPPTMASNAVCIVPNASKGLFALLTSSMHMAWMRLTAGRLCSGYRYSINSVYNTFPVPPLALKDPTLEALGQAVLDARDDRPLGKQYDTAKMTPSLRAAHAAVDAYVDRLYVPEGFTCEEDRVIHLLTRYYDMRKK